MKDYNFYKDEILESNRYCPLCKERMYFGTPTKVRKTRTVIFCLEEHFVWEISRAGYKMSDLFRQTYIINGVSINSIDNKDIFDQLYVSIEEHDKYIRRLVEILVFA